MSEQVAATGRITASKVVLDQPAAPSSAPPPPAQPIDYDVAATPSDAAQGELLILWPER